MKLDEERQTRLEKLVGSYVPIPSPPPPIPGIRFFELIQDMDIEDVIPYLLQGDGAEWDDPEDQVQVYRDVWEDLRTLGPRESQRILFLWEYVDRHPNEDATGWDEENIVEAFAWPLSRPTDPPPHYTALAYIAWDEVLGMRVDLGHHEKEEFVAKVLIEITTLGYSAKEVDDELASLSLLSDAVSLEHPEAIDAYLDDMQKEGE